MSQGRKYERSAGIFQLVSILVSLVVLFVWIPSQSGEYLGAINLIYFGGIAQIVFLLVLPLVVASGYLSKQEWSWNCHLVKASGLTYGTLTFLPLAAASSVWPMFVLMSAVLLIDSAFLAMLVTDRAPIRKSG